MKPISHRTRSVKDMVRIRAEAWLKTPSLRNRCVRVLGGQVLWTDTVVSDLRVELCVRTFRSCRRLVSALFRPRCSCSQRMSSKKSMWKGLVRTSNLDAHVTTHEGGQIYQNIRNACSLTFGCSIGNIWATGKATHKQDITLDTKQSFTPN